MEEALMSCQSVMYMYSAVSWLFDKSEEININSNSGNRIFGNDNKFQENDFITARTKNGKYMGDVFESFQGPKKNIVAADKSFRSCDLTIQAILLVSLQCRYLQKEKIKAFQLKNS